MSAATENEAQQWLRVRVALRDYIREYVPTNSDLFMDDFKECVTNAIDDLVEEASE